MTPSDERKIEKGIKSFDPYWYIDTNTSEVRHIPLKGWSKLLDLFWRKKHKVSNLYWWAGRKLDSAEYGHVENIINHDDVPIDGFPRKHKMLNNWNIPQEDLKYLYEGPLLNNSSTKILVKHQSSLKKIISIFSQLRPLGWLIPLIIFSYRYWGTIEELIMKAYNAI